MSTPPRIVYANKTVRAVWRNSPCGTLVVEKNVKDAMGADAWVRADPTLGSTTELLEQIVFELAEAQAAAIEAAYREGWKDGWGCSRAHPKHPGSAEVFNPCWDDSCTKAKLNRAGEW